MLSRMLGVVFGIFLSFILLGCDDKPIQKFQATVNDIRMTFELPSNTSSQEGHPVAGALFGGAIAGTKGAIIGAVIGSQSVDKIKNYGRLSACSFNVITSDGRKATFKFAGESGSMLGNAMQKCSTFRDNDSIEVYLSKDTSFSKLEWYTGSYGHNSEY